MSDENDDTYSETILNSSNNNHHLHRRSPRATTGVKRTISGNKPFSPGMMVHPNNNNNNNNSSSSSSSNILHHEGSDVFIIDDDDDDDNNNNNGNYKDGDDDMNGNNEHDYKNSSEPKSGGEFVSSSASLGTASLAVLVFYSVSGGPFGIESSVRAGGYFYTLLGLLIGPLVFSAQEALMTAELACVFPEASGGMAWVEEAFGSIAGWMAGYLGWMAGATDNAIYPVLFLDYLLQVMGSKESAEVAMHPTIRFVCLGVMSCALSYVNWLGLDLVGKMSITICCIAMSPFVIMSVVGIFKIDFSNWFQMPDSDELDLLFNTTDDDIGGGLFPNAMQGGILWRPFLNNLFWNLNSFDAAASFSADVGDHPEQVFPKAMIYSVIMVAASYIIPIAVAIGATASQPYEWVDGYLATITGEIAGPWLEGWTILAAGISNIALYQAELSADAFQLMGMADRGHVPKIFATRSIHGTPTYGIMLGTVIIIFMGFMGLDKLIEMLNFNYAISLLLEYSAFLYLRIKQPNLRRPWRIPLSTTGCIVFFAPTYFFIILVLLLSTYETFVFSICTNLFGIFVYLWKHGQLDTTLNRMTSIVCYPFKRWGYCIVYSPAPLDTPDTMDENQQQNQLHGDGIMMTSQINNNNKKFVDSTTNDHLTNTLT